MAVYCTPAQVSEITGQQYRDAMLKLGTISGPFTVGEVVAGALSGASGIVTVYASPIMQCVVEYPELAKFQKGENITGATSLETATIAAAIEQTLPTRSAILNLCSRVSLELERYFAMYGVGLPLAVDPAIAAMVTNGACAGVAAIIEAQLYLQNPQNESQRRGVFAKQYADFVEMIETHATMFGAATTIAHNFPDPATNASPFHVADGEIF
jgi:hypothetical protein